MPILFRVRHGPRKAPEPRTDAGKELSFKEYENAFGEYEIGQFSENGPEINKESPSSYYESVVVRVRQGEAGKHGGLSKQGFYLIKDLRPEVAYRLMNWS